MTGTMEQSSSSSSEQASTNPSHKRQKTNVPLQDVLSPHILANETQWQHDYQSATPYPHGRLTDMFVDGFLEQVLEEIQQNTKVHFKESDLFRVYQSVDLGNLRSDNEHATQQLPTLMTLKNALYSERYRAFLERVTSLPPGTLTDHVDCAANCHAPGCHLLCHDDVIGTRKISFIIYLTEPNWSAEEGGALELYSGGDRIDNDSTTRVPEVFPSKTVLPAFNSMAFFQVQPGVSFHSVQEVYGERPRLSIQGWYHAKEAPAQIENATLNRLKSTATGEDTDGEYTSATTWSDTKESGDCDDVTLELSEVDQTFLSVYINETYLKEDSILEIRDKFEEESSVQLRQFLLPQWADGVQATAAQHDKGLGRGCPPETYDVGVNDGWEAVGPAHKQRFLEYVGSGGNKSAGYMLQELQTKLFQSEAFGRFLNRLTSLGLPLGYRGGVRRFRPGLDYTVAHFGILTTEAVLDATLCFAAGKGEQSQFDEETGEPIGSTDDALWESGDCGGFECYIAADDEREEAAAEYNADDDTELLSVSASNNTLSLVYRDPGTMRFVKYVGCRAPSSRWDISMEYQLDNTDDKEVHSDENDDGKVSY